MNWIVIVIVLLIIGSIMTAIHNLYAKAKVAFHKNSDPEKALEAAEDAYYDDAMTINGYENQLLKIAESSQSPDIMRKLVKFYTEEKKDDQKAQYWSHRAIQCGDLETMMDFYGFSDYDVSYSDYDTMLSELNSIRVTSDEKLFTLNYCKGIAYYKIGQTETAKQSLESCKKLIGQSQDLSSDSSFENSCNYLIFLCYCKENNMEEAQKLLLTLEEKEFAVPAEGYLNIYNYYADQRKSGSPIYVMEIMFAEKYAACDDADREKADQIAAETYYLTAVAYENGINGLEKNIEQSMFSYERAAHFGHTEALYYIGTHCWSANNHVRDYVKANDYLIKAASKGHQKSKEFLSRYGVDEILVIPANAEKTTYNFMGGYKVTASADTIKWLHIMAGVLYRKESISKMFLNTYSSKIQSFDALISNIHQVYADHVAIMLQWCISLLMHFGIDTYSAQDIMDMCDDLSLLPRVPLFEQGIEKIDDRAEELNLKTAYSQATRGYWSGSGFGTTISETIKAGINASVAAGVMNIGSGILHGIGDSIVESLNNSEIKSMGKDLFEKKETKIEFYNAVRSACFEIGDAALQIIETQFDMDICRLDGEIVFKNESLSDIDDKTLDTKIANNLLAKNHEYVYAMLIERLRRNPLDGGILKTILVNMGLLDQPSSDEDFNSVFRYAGDFMIDVSETMADIEKQLQRRIQNVVNP